MSFKVKGKIKTFLDVQRLRDFIVRRPTLKGILRKSFRQKKNYTQGKLKSPQRNETGKSVSKFKDFSHLLISFKNY